MVNNFLNASIIMKKISKIIIGTHNRGKFKEISDLLPSNLSKISPWELKLPSPEEVGLTFKENSEIKAKFFSKNSDLLCISDDSGLEIKLLNGDPGIYSARWAEPGNNFNNAIIKVFKELEKKDPNWKINKKIEANFICCLSICLPNGKIISREGKINGSISNSKRGVNGFGYDPIFIPDGYSQTFGEMEQKLKYKIDHRSKAYENIKKFLFNLLI